MQVFRFRAGWGLRAPWTILLRRKEYAPTQRRVTHGFPPTVARVTDNRWFKDSPGLPIDLLTLLGETLLCYVSRGYPGLFLCRTLWGVILCNWFRRRNPFKMGATWIGDSVWEFALSHPRPGVLPLAVLTM